MGQSVRQAARRRALQAQAKMRKERAEAERRRSALGVEIVVALSERDMAVERYEALAADALIKLLRDEGLTAEAVGVWADGLSSVEVKRLKRIAARSD